MKIIAALIVMASSSLTQLAVGQPSSAASEKMQIFKSWSGHWTGEGTMQRGPGEPQKSSVDEQVTFKLDSTILILEGIGKKADPATGAETIVHHAFGVLSYDHSAGEYKIQTYLNDGKSTSGWFKVVNRNEYQWGFKVPGGNVRYSITIDPVKKTWNETGEFSNDGSAWMKFFHMSLRKV